MKFHDIFGRLDTLRKCGGQGVGLYRVIQYTRTVIFFTVPLFHQWNSEEN